MIFSAFFPLYPLMEIPGLYMHSGMPHRQYLHNNKKFPSKNTKKSYFPSLKLHFIIIIQYFNPDGKFLILEVVSMV